MSVTPVTFPPGRGRLAATPYSTGSLPIKNTTGVDWVATWQPGRRVHCSQWRSPPPGDAPILLPAGSADPSPTVASTPISPRRTRRPAPVPMAADLHALLGRQDGVEGRGVETPSGPTSPGRRAAGIVKKFSLAGGEQELRRTFRKPRISARRHRRADKSAPARHASADGHMLFDFARCEAALANTPIAPA
jgi:hypothetical protein